MAEAIGLAASIITVIDLSAKVASQCSKYYANFKNARNDIERLQKEAQRLKTILEQVQLLCESPNAAKLQASQILSDEIKDCKKQLAELEMKLEPRKRPKVMSRYGMHALIWPFKDNKICGIIKKLEKCKDNISLTLQVGQVSNVLTIHQEILLNRLRSAEDAAFDSHAEEHNARCYQGTRVELLQQIDIWASDVGSECIYWLNRMAGTGKSTISRSVAQTYTDKGNLGASFFFKRGEGDRSHAELFFSTIALQLVKRLPLLASHVQSAIEVDPNISKKSLNHQFATLFLQPLGKLGLDPQIPSRILIVVDALDECEQEEDIRVIIRLLSEVKQITSVNLKFFLTSRPELPIRLGFEDISGRYKGLALHQIPEPIVREDISTFLEHKLAIVRDDYNKSVHPNRRLPTDWPGQSIIQRLVRMAFPLFIFATTICRYINDRKCGQPEGQLAKVLKFETKSQSSKLDATYLPVVDQLLAGVTALERQDIVEEFRKIVGSIVIVARPLSATSLDLLLGIPQGTVDCRTDLLHSVLSIPSNPDLPIRLFHLSFRDFLVDNEKRESNPFWINEKDVHKRLAARCLQRLSTGGYLKKDICNLRTRETPRADIDKQTIDAHLPPDIQYACQYWVYHLKEGGGIICDGNQAHSFLNDHFLHWLEALSLIGRISESISLITNLIEMLHPTASIKASALLYDINRFILTYISIADLSPLQLYSAALIFAPKESIVQNIFQNYIPDWISKQPKVELNWCAIQQTLDSYTSHIVTWVAFSHNSKLLASSSVNNSISIWDAATGSLQQILEGHSDAVYSVAFSHDSRLLASASEDKTIKVWDTTTGSLQQTPEGHSKRVSSVKFSHNSKLLASVSDDNTIKIWDTTTSSLQHTLEGQRCFLLSVIFSHDSRLLVSASSETIRIWNTATGSLQLTLEGHSRRIALSHDSRLLVSPSWDKTIKIWDLYTGSLQQTLEGHANQVSFLHDSRLLVSLSQDMTIKIWDLGTGSLRQTLEGHTDHITSVVFSHDSKFLAYASFDKTIKIWDLGTGSVKQTLEGYTDCNTSVVFSHDSKFLASASFDKTIKIWDTATGSLLQTLEGPNVKPWLVVFSHNWRLLASVSLDHNIKIWDTATSSLQQSIDNNNLTAESTILHPILSEFSLEESNLGRNNLNGLGICKSWITWNAQNLLWLPPDYRGYATAISQSGSTVAIGCESGKVLVIEFSLAILSKS